MRRTCSYIGPARRKKRKVLHLRMNRLSLAHESPFIGKVKAIHFFLWFFPCLFRNAFLWRIRTDSDSAEDLIMDISIQCLHLLLCWQAGIHLQERHGNFDLRSEEWLSSSLCSYALRSLFNQPERYRHRSKRKKWFDASNNKTIATITHDGAFVAIAI